MDSGPKRMPSCVAVGKELVGIVLFDVCLDELDWRGS